MKGAGLKIRFKAFLFDYLIISVYLIMSVGFSMLMSTIYPGLLDNFFSFETPVRSQLFAFFIVTLPIGIYFVLTEWKYGKTYGKSRVGIEIHDLSLSQSFVRTTTKFIPWELSHTFIWQVNAGNLNDSSITIIVCFLWLLIGLYMGLIVLRSDKRSLYDIISRTQVVVVQ